MTKDFTLKILVFSQYFWPESFLINDLAQSLTHRGHEVEVLTGKPNYPYGKKFKGYKGFGLQSERYNDIQIYRIPLLSRGMGKLRLALNYISFIISGLIFSPIALRGKRYDVIFVYALSPILQVIPAIFLGRIKKVPIVVSVQDLWPDSLQATGYIKNRIILKLIERLVRFIYRNVDLLLVQSEAFLEPVKSMSGQTPIKYYPNSVDQKLTMPISSTPKDVTGLTEGFSIMFAGNIGSAQATEIIIEAASILKSYKDIELLVNLQEVNVTPNLDHFLVII